MNTKILELGDGIDAAINTEDGEMSVIIFRHDFETGDDHQVADLAGISRAAAIRFGGDLVQARLVNDLGSVLGPAKMRALGNEILAIAQAGF